MRSSFVLWPSWRTRKRYNVNWFGLFINIPFPWSVHLFAYLNIDSIDIFNFSQNGILNKWMFHSQASCFEMLTHVTSRPVTVISDIGFVWKSQWIPPYNKSWQTGWLSTSTDLLTFFLIWNLSPSIRLHFLLSASHIFTHIVGEVKV